MAVLPLIVTLPVIYILMAIGMLVGAWIVSGTVPLLMLYGLDLVNPGLFLPAVCIVCSFISIATGHFSRGDMIKFIENAFRSSWLESTRKNSYLHRLTRYQEGHPIDT